MGQPDLGVLIDGWWGGSYDTSILVGGVASNVVIGSNPAYAIADFLSFYPKFGSYTAGPPAVYAGLIPQPVLQAYINLASACLVQARWLDSWTLAMGLFVAHYCTLYLQSEGSPGTTAQSVAASGLTKGVLVSKGAGGVNAGMQTLIGEWGSWGQWNMTVYGTSLMTQAKMIGAGMMYIM